MPWYSMMAISMVLMAYSSYMPRFVGHILARILG